MDNKNRDLNYNSLKYVPSIPQPVSPSQFGEDSYSIQDANANFGCASPYSQGYSNEDYSVSSYAQERQSHNYSQRIENLDGYWVLPHVKKHRSKGKSNHSNAHYITPGGRYLNRMPKKHTAGIQFLANEEMVNNTATVENSCDMNQFSKYSTFDTPVDPSMTVTFHYDPFNDIKTSFNQDILIRMQAHCRTCLAKLRKKRRLKEDDAVCCIQRNAASYFDPWVRLILALRPHLKRNRLEDEILQLKSELERFKAMVKVLRYENVAYQDKISRLLQLLDQMHPGSGNSDLVNKLVKEISMAVADHQKQWAAMVSTFPNNAVNYRKPLVNGAENIDSSIDPLAESSYQQARDNAEFYRNQLEMLREEVDDQNSRAGQHYEEKIGVLSERVEQLQNMLTNEGYRADRLNEELESTNTQLAETRMNETNLNKLLNELKESFENDPTTPIGALIEAKESEKAYANVPVKITPESEAQHLLDKIRKYFVNNAESYEILKNTPLGIGGELDIFQNINQYKEPFADSNHQLQGSFFPNGSKENKQDAQSNLDYGTTPSQSMNSVFNSQANIANYHISRQSEENEMQLDLMQQKLDEETEYRDSLELEMDEMRNRFANLNRQFRRQRAEFDEEMVEKDQSNMRKIRELNDMIDDISKEKQNFENRCYELQNKLEILNQVPDLSDSENVTDELQDKYTKVITENRRYQKELELVRNEFENFKYENNTQQLTNDLADREERISQLEVAQHHARSELEISNVRLQNANSLLKDNELRLAVASKERQAMTHRINQLENEHDKCILEMAQLQSRSHSDRENLTTKQRKLDELKDERNTLRRDLMELKIALTEASTKALAEKQGLEKRIIDMETSIDKREIDLKSEIERFREQFESLQQENSELQKNESATKTDNRHLKRQVNDLQDTVDTYSRRVGELERSKSDLVSELDKTKLELRSSLETANFFRDQQSRIKEDDYLLSSDQDEVQYSDEEVNSSNEKLFSATTENHGGGIQTLDRYQEKRKRQNRNSFLQNKAFSHRSLSRPAGKSNLQIYRSFNQLPTVQSKSSRSEYQTNERKTPQSVIINNSDEEIS